MSRMKNKILLVGSIPGASAAEAMRTCGEGIGEYLDCMPDGETGNRRIWINFLAATTYHNNDALQTVNRPARVDPKKPGEWRQPGEDWVPRGYDDHWQFRVKPNVDKIVFEDLGYSKAAKESYPDFCDLRDEGLIAKDARFMVAIPLVESAVRPFLNRVEDFAPMRAAYEEALQREVMNLTDCIPASDLVIQWDICMEVLAVETHDELSGLFPWKPPLEPMERFLSAISTAAALVPAKTVMGLHLCYGDLGHRHLIEPPSLKVVVEMAQGAAAAVDRTIDYYHMPVPRDRSDDAYFEPLRDFDPGDAKLYLGLIHVTGGQKTSLALLETAKKYAHGFGVATECGFGRRSAESMPELLAIHRDIAERLQWDA